jgi:hypothetical protein
LFVLVYRKMKQDDSSDTFFFENEKNKTIIYVYHRTLKNLVNNFEKAKEVKETIQEGPDEEVFTKQLDHQASTTKRIVLTVNRYQNKGYIFVKLLFDKDNNGTFLPTK